MAKAPLIYAGIDEAGYGPMLGPLCAAAAVFVVENHDTTHDGAPNLWEILDDAVCRRPNCDDNHDFGWDRMTLSVPDLHARMRGAQL